MCVYIYIICMCVYEYIRARESEGKREGRKERRKEGVTDGLWRLETRYIYPRSDHPPIVNE